MSQKEQKDEKKFQEEIKQLQALKRHIRNVQDACELLAERIIETSGDLNFARLLIANSFLHDHSKFKGIEWEYLIRDVEEDKLQLAIQQHQASNQHHPEYWGGIDNMPKIYIAEMVCDWYARSNEFGTDLREWIKKQAVDKYKLSLQGKSYKQIKEFVDLLLDSPFK